MELKSKKPKVSALLSHPQENTDRENWWYAQPIAVIVVAFVVAFIVINLAFDDPPAPAFRSAREEAAYYIDHGDPVKAEDVYDSLLSLKDSDRVIDLNYAYINSHYANTDHAKTVMDSTNPFFVRRSDTGIKDYYIALFNIPSDSITSDPLGLGAYHKEFYTPASPSSLQVSIGHYGYGLCLGLEQYYRDALDQFLRVPDQNLKYLNNSIGRAYIKLDSVPLAEPFFRKEIALKGNIGGAYTNLFPILAKEERWKDISQLLKDSVARSYCPNSVVEASFFADGDFFGYIKAVGNGFSENLNSYGFIAALLILLCWLFYLRRIDLFQSEKWKYLIMTCLLGIMTSVLVFPVTSFVFYSTGWNLNGHIFNDYFYCIFRIGLVEESVKIIPLLIGIYLTKEIVEPVDYIIYGSVAALGFGFAENLLYFDSAHLNIITGRALSSAFGHIFFTSVIAYALVLNKFSKRKTNAIILLPGALLLAAFLHGTYDFWLLDGTGSWKLVSMLIMLLGAIQYGIFIENALNQSPNFNQDKIFDAHRLKLYLIYAFASIILTEFILVSITQGHTKGNHALLGSALLGGYLIFWLSNRLGALTVHQGEWVPGLEELRHGTVPPNIKDALLSLARTSIYVGGFALIRNPLMVFYAVRFIFAKVDAKKKLALEEQQDATT
jgi:RsiW-degrading membrane proteinase PrsW (M82 family)